MFLLRKNEMVREEQAMLSLRETGLQGITSFYLLRIRVPRTASIFVDNNTSY